jgi:hypothetical protein
MPDGRSGDLACVLQASDVHGSYREVTTSQIVLAEVGTDMTNSTSAHLPSWAGLGFSELRSIILS